jgi:DNA-binding NarL/FixJ family response regulator
MQILLSEDRKRVLESQHRKERDGRVRDRLKAVLLKSEGWSEEAIAQALRIHESTVREHLNEWMKHERFCRNKPNLVKWVDKIPAQTN